MNKTTIKSESERTLKIEENLRISLISFLILLALVEVIYWNLYPTTIYPLTCRSLVQISIVIIGIFYPLTVNLALNISNRISERLGNWTEKIPEIFSEKTKRTIFSLVKLGYREIKSEEELKEYQKIKEEMKKLEKLTPPKEMVKRFQKMPQHIRNMALTGLPFIIGLIYIDIYLLIINEPIKTNDPKFIGFMILFAITLTIILDIFMETLKFTTVTEIIDKTVREGTKLLNEITKTIKIIKEIKD
nr:hypothetical protein [Candidatus Baldrarchaeota archaeon]